MPNTNIVEFGLEGVKYSIMTAGTGGSFTFAAPVAVPGAVDLTFEVTTQEAKFYADNLAYYVLNSLSGRTGNLEMAKFSDAFKKDVLGWKETTDGGLAEIDNAKPKDFALVFVGDGDAHKVKHVVYRCSPGKIERSHHTNEEGIDVETEVLPISILGVVVGDDHVAHVRYPYGSTGYTAIDTAVTMPAFPALP